VSNIEWSSDQIKKAIYTDSLNAWVGKVAYDEKVIMLKAPILSALGYEMKITDPHDVTQEYEKASS
jgi:hypothetical protein